MGTEQFSFYDGPWENSQVPTVVQLDEHGGDPHILAMLSRVHNPDALHQLCAAANLFNDLFNSPHFQVSIGGNPILVERMLDRINDLRRAQAGDAL